METTPDSAPPAPDLQSSTSAGGRRLKLRLLICNPKSCGAKNIYCKGRVGNPARTRDDPYLPTLYSYECKSYPEWQALALGISKQVSNQNSFFAHAHFIDADRPPGPTARVELVAGGLYPEGIIPTPAPAQTAADFTLDCIKATIASYAGQPATPQNLQECLDRIANAVRGTVVKEIDLPPARYLELPPLENYGYDAPKSQEGSEPSEAHNLSEGGSTPPPQPASLREALPAGATISPSEAQGAKEDQMGGALQSGSGDEPLSEAEPTLSNAECGMPNDEGAVPETPPDVIVEDMPTTIEGSPSNLAAAIITEDAAQGTTQEEKWQKALKAKAAPSIPNPAKFIPPAKKTGKKK